MTASLNSINSSQSSLQHNGVDVVKFGANGITQGAPFSFRNRIINGDMRIDQRNNVAAVTTTGAFPVDRFQDQITYGSLSFQQSPTAPTRFKSSVAVTVTTGGSVAAADRNSLAQWIEGYNIADLCWGTANAQPITLSFWVRSSLTGTFSGCVSNSVFDRSYVFTYSIAAANTWEYKTVTITGETSGAWNNTNGQGLKVSFDLGTGSTKQATAGSWQNGDYRAATGAVQLSNTIGATFYLTGVQLEKGSVATPFEFRPYGTELALCQRYFETGSFYFRGYDVAGGAAGATRGFSVTKRSAPTMTVTPFSYTNASGASTTNITADGVGLFASVTATGGAHGYINWTASAEL